MTLTTVTRANLEAASNHFLRRVNPIVGAPLGEIDLLRGHRDDFFGDLLRDEYTPQTVGGGSLVTLQDAAHGGWVRLTADTADGNSAALYLGSAAGGFDSLDADDGWVMFWRMRANQLTNIQATAGVYSVGGNDFLYAGFRSDISAANWMIRCVAGGVATNIDTGVAADTGWHWHTLFVRAITGGRQVDYWVDGAPIGTNTVNVSGVIMEPVLFCVNRGGAAPARTADFDMWRPTPRNL